MLLGVWPAVPKVMMAVVDVRNVAEAHLQAIKVPEARNERIILCNRTFFLKSLCEIFVQHYGEGTYPVKLEEMTECPPENKRFKLVWERKYDVDHSKSERLLGIKYIDIKDTLIEMAEKMIQDRVIPDHRKK